jgi:hypothetical protein
MLLDLVIWTSALAVVPLVLGALECWLLGGLAPAPGGHTGGSAIAVPTRCRPKSVTEPLLYVSGPMTVSPAEGSPCLRLYCSLAGLTEAAYTERK